MQSKIPVKVVFRQSAPIGGISGPLAGAMVDAFNKPQVMAIMPYHPLPDGMKGNDMVAMLSEGGERDMVHYPTIIKNTVPSTPEHYNNLLHEMGELGGYEVTIIQCTNIDHLLRRAERTNGDKAPEELVTGESDDDAEFEVEEIVIELDIVNDDLDTDAGFDSDEFKEEWA